MNHDFTKYRSAQDNIKHLRSSRETNSSTKTETPTTENATQVGNTPVVEETKSSIGMTGSDSVYDAYGLYDAMCKDITSLSSTVISSATNALGSSGSSVTESISNIISEEDSNLDLTGVFGMPYKFTELADIRGTTDKYGRTYIKNFVEAGNFVSFKVGRPRFMPGVSNDNSAPIVSNAISGGDTDTLGRMMDDMKVGQLFGFDEAMYEYWEMVGLLVRACSIFMGMKDAGYAFDATTPNWSVVESHWGQYASKYISGHPSRGDINVYSDTGWISEATEKEEDQGVLERQSFRVVMAGVKKIWDNTGGAVANKITSTANNMLDKGIEFAESIVGAKQKLILNNVVTFYNDGPVEVQEGGSNSIGASMFKGLLNGSSLGQAGAVLDMAKEMSFLTGAQSHKTFYQYNSENKAEKIKTKHGSMLANMFGGPAGFFATNTSMPDVWKDSSYDKSFNIKIKLSTPYGNRMSIFKDIIVPLCHILPLGMPNRGSMSVNSYTSPYILNVLVKGSVNCQMGIVQSIAISKNQETISLEGLPTDVDIVLNIKDLTSAFSLPNTISTKGLLESPGLLSYLSTMCGINVDNVEGIMYQMAKMEANARIKTLGPSMRSLATKKFTDIVGGIGQVFSFTKRTGR
ncbi:MAG: hypothetical protein ACRCZ9_12445 [Fusobacteriaceae bacterium]